MRRELDAEADVMRTTFRDDPIVATQEFEFDGARHVHFLAADGAAVRLEIHGYSGLMERQKRREEQTRRTIFEVKADQDRMVGEIGWMVTDVRSGVTVGEGRKEVRLGDISIRIIETAGDAQAKKAFLLTDLFALGVSTGLTPERDLSGFALVADRTDQKTFCWEWFEVDTESHATKLQESGELGIGFANPGGIWQIVRIEFLTDISIRVHRFGQDGPGGPPSWRLLVRKDSWVDWPSVVDGVVTM